MAYSAAQRYLAEFLGTFALLLVGGGAALFSVPGALGEARTMIIAFGFGLAVVAGAYAFGDVSGAHFNPAVTLSMALGRKMPLRDVVPYLVAQVAGSIVGIAVVLGIASGAQVQLDAAQATALASQCYAGSGAPAGCAFSLASVFLLELSLTFVFVLVIHIVTRSGSAARNLAPLAIGLALTGVILVAVPVDGASINPVRTFAPALLSAIWPSARWALAESWLFWVAPILGGLLATAVDRMIPAQS